VTDTLPHMAEAIHITVVRSEIRSVMGPSLGEIIKAVKAQSIGPTARRTRRRTISIFACPSPPLSRVWGASRSGLPSLKVVQTVHEGFRAPLYRPRGAR
jgi:hypothetical protein